MTDQNQLMTRQDMLHAVQEIMSDGLLPAAHARALRLILNTLSRSIVSPVRSVGDALPPRGKRVLAWPMGGCAQFAILSDTGQWLDVNGNPLYVVEWAEI